VKTKRSLFKTILLGIGILIVLVVYAYGFQVTKISLDEISSERRQQSFVRVLRALARPHIIEYEREEVQTQVPFYIPCPPGGPEAVDIPEPVPGEPYVVVDPPCAEPRATVQVQGNNFPPNSSGPVQFLPPSGVALLSRTVEIDRSGNFSIEYTLPNRPEDAEQAIRVIARTDVGTPRFTRSAIDTWDKIIETIFLALLATTLGTIFAVPLSFFAARNLMKDINSTVIGLALTIFAWPLGMLLGWILANWVGQTTLALTLNPVVNAVGILGGFVLVVGAMRWALPQEEIQRPDVSTKVVRMIVLFASTIAFLFIAFLLARAMVSIGGSLALSLGAFSFLGVFVRNVGEILQVTIAALAAVAVGGVLSSIAGKLGRRMQETFTQSLRVLTQTILISLAGAFLAVLLGAGIDWIYLINDPTVTMYIPAVVGAVAGLGAAFKARKIDSLPTGLIIYFIARLIFNGLRSIESLIMAIVFVVWVGLGPFAGVLALALHTIASQAKLFSEQVESILPGPIEAVKATGANRLQTIVYAVMPQIIPPYISFTMYRWDINVRMSTIIGLAGGGGIGSLLIQNANLLNYRAASVQMLAIVIVVSIMDYLSSYMREKVV
jgi:phosphonate ABC transporter permease subunit PhnE